MWTAGRVVLGVALGAAIVSAASRLAATRSRNDRLTVIRYTAPSHWSVYVPIPTKIPAAPAQSTSPVTTRSPFDWEELWQTGF